MAAVCNFGNIVIKFLASCFDVESAKNYIKVGGKVFKIPSGEINNLSLLEYIGKKNKKIVGLIHLHHCLSRGIK